MRSPRQPRAPRAPRHARQPRSRPALSPADPQVQPYRNRPAKDLVMIANGVLPWPPDLSDEDEKTIEQVRRANAQRDRLNRAAGKGGK